MRIEDIETIIAYIVGFLAIAVLVIIMIPLDDDGPDVYC